MQSEEIISKLRPGYEHNADAASFALNFLNQHFEVDAEMKRDIQHKIEQAELKKLKG